MGSDCGGDQRGQDELRTAARLARKQQLRGAGIQSRLRSDSSMQEVAQRVQFKESMDVIRAERVTEVMQASASAHVAPAAFACLARAPPGGESRGPFTALATPLNLDFPRLAAEICQSSAGSEIIPSGKWWQATATRRGPNVSKKSGSIYGRLVGC
jgi:hypothetical protein